MQSAVQTNVVENQYVVSLGEALYDMLADQPDLPKEKVKSWTPYIGGAPTNLATGMSRLNVDTHVVTNIGKDQLGDDMMRFFREECRDRTIQLSGVQRSEHPTRDVLVTRSSQGDCYFSGFSQNKDSYADSFIDKDQIPMNLLSNASILVTGTLGLAFPKTREAMEYAVDQINNNSLVGRYQDQSNQGIGHVGGIYVKDGKILSPSEINPGMHLKNEISNGNTVPSSNDGAIKSGLQSKVQGKARNSILSKVFVDLNWRPVFFDDPVSAKMMIENYLKKADYLKVTAEEAQWLTGINGNVAFENPSRLFEHFSHIKLILISNGKYGASYAYQHNNIVIQGRQPAFKIKPVDTTGAGDSFNSGFMAYLLQNYQLNDFNNLEKEDWDKALSFAIGTSALTCMGKGAIAPQPTYGAVLQFLEKQKVYLEAALV